MESLYFFVRMIWLSTLGIKREELHPPFNPQSTSLLFDWTREEIEEIEEEIAGIYLLYALK